MKKKNKRYYGMTVTQIGILVGSAVFGLLIIGVIFVVVLTSTPKAQLPVATAVVPASKAAATVVVMTDTPTPTATLASVGVTMVPPGDWVEFKTKNATIWLPSNFIGGDMLDGKQESINKVSRLGKYYKGLVAGMKNADKDVVLWMVDKAPKLTAFFSFVVVERENLTEDTDLDAYVKSLMNKSSLNGMPFSEQVAVNENKKLSVLGRQARRLTWSKIFTGASNVEVVDIAYFIKDGADVWVVEFYVTPEDYVTILPDFEKSIQTFNIIQ